MKRLDQRQISDVFNEQKARFEKQHAASGLLDAMEQFSRAIGDLKAAGHDLQLQFHGNASEEAFAMFTRTGGLTVPVSGVLRIGTNDRLVAFATKMNGEPVLQLAMSEFDIVRNGIDGKVAEGNISPTVRSTVFDLKKDPEALVKFQTEVLRSLARNEVVNDRDKANAFDNGASRLSKRPLPPPREKGGA